ncbi:MAG: hypothetical protein Q8L98_07990 [Chlamydiales bacterium]|nr:hypothetical protein [Chlamydiales bacterium]
MTSFPTNKISNSSEWETFFQYEEDLQTSTVQKSSEVAQAVFSSPSQDMEDWTLSHSLDVPDSLLSPSDIQLEAVSYYEQGPFSLEELFEEPGRKRKASHQGEVPASKCSRLLEPYGGEDKSISQLDGFSQMVDPFEVFGFSKEDWMDEFARPGLDSHEEFMQEELAHREETVDFYESLDVDDKETDEQIKEQRSALSDPSEIIEGQTASSEVAFHIKESRIKNLNMSDKEGIVLKAVHQDPSAGSHRLFNTLRDQGFTISANDVFTVFKRCEITTERLRNDAVKAGWLIPKILSSCTTQEFNDWLYSTSIMDDFTKQKVIAMISKDPERNNFEITRALRESGVFVSFWAVNEFLRQRGLNVIEIRKKVFAPNRYSRGASRFVILPTRTPEELKEVETSQKSHSIRATNIAREEAREQDVLPSQKWSFQPLKRKPSDQGEKRKQALIALQMQSQTLSNPLFNASDDQKDSDYRIEDCRYDKRNRFA